MREVPSLRVEAGASVELKPGGYHLMLMRPVAPLQAGQSVNLVMTAADGREFSFEVPVERR
jgi:copper(I)-binding protein